MNLFKWHKVIWTQNLFSLSSFNSKTMHCNSLQMNAKYRACVRGRDRVDNRCFLFRKTYKCFERFYSKQRITFSIHFFFSYFSVSYFDLSQLRHMLHRNFEDKCSSVTKRREELRLPQTHIHIMRRKKRQKQSFILHCSFSFLFGWPVTLIGNATSLFFVCSFLDTSKRKCYT